MSFSENIKIWAVGVVGAFFLRTLNRTLRWENLDRLADPQFWQTNRGGIFAFWHGRQLMMTFTKVDFEKETPLYVLISKHSDGRMISETINRLGLPSIAGSSTRGGTQAARELLDALHAGSHIGITPDGPRGPAYRSKKGVIFLASQSGRPIYPCTFSAQKFWRFKSWDGMLLPKPFSRAVRIMGDPIFVPADVDSESVKEYQALLDQRLNEMTERADAHVYV